MVNMMVLNMMGRFMVMLRMIFRFRSVIGGLRS